MILAHYFALLGGFSNLWHIGDAGQREVRGISSALPDEWMELMQAPLQAIGDI